MHSAFQYNKYLLKRQVAALTGKLRLFSPDGRLVMYTEQKMFKLKEDIRVYADESKGEELLYIQARQVIDFSAAYDVKDSQTGVLLGVIRRRGWQSMARDEWSILDASEQPIASVIEDTMEFALLRRLLLGSLLPQSYDVIADGTRIADITQRFHLLRFEMDLDFNADRENRLDRRLGVAAAMLLAIIEGRQN